MTHDEEIELRKRLQWLVDQVKAETKNRPGGAVDSIANHVEHVIKFVVELEKKAKPDNIKTLAGVPTPQVNLRGNSPNK